jgi:hypothetical protein
MNRTAHSAANVRWVSVILMVFTLPLDVESATASIVKGSLVFDNNAFADNAKMIAGSIISFEGGATSVKDALTGPDLSTAFDIGEFNQGEVVQVDFLDNAVINATGFDLVVYERHSPDCFDVAVGIGANQYTSFLHFVPVYENFIEGGGYVNAARIDLLDFGVGAGATVSSIRIRESSYDSAELAGIAAFHSVNVPEPTTLALLSITAVSVLLCPWLRRLGRRTACWHCWRRG